MRKVGDPNHFPIGKGDKGNWNNGGERSRGDGKGDKGNWNIQTEKGSDKEGRKKEVEEADKSKRPKTKVPKERWRGTVKDAYGKSGEGKSPKSEKVERVEIEVKWDENEKGRMRIFSNVIVQEKKGVREGVVTVEVCEKSERTGDY